MAGFSSVLRILSTVGTLLTIPAPEIQGQNRPTGDASILDPTSELEVLFEGEFRTEGPSIGFDGTIYFVDFDLGSGGRLWRFDPETGEASVLRAPSGFAAGSAIDPDGNLLTAEYAFGGGRRISRMDLVSTETAAVTDGYEGRPYNGANDLVLDEAGRIYFTEIDYRGSDEDMAHRESGVYRVDPNGTVYRIIADAGMPNGILVSPDQRTLYVGKNEFDTLGNGAILAYDLAADGSVQFRSILVLQEAEDQCLADGMAVDVDGNLYVALFSQQARTGIAVYRPDGEQLAFIPTPGPATNVTFGLGSDSTSLYITAGSGLYRFPVKREGYHPSWRQPR